MPVPTSAPVRRRVLARGSTLFALTGAATVLAVAAAAAASACSWPPPGGGSWQNSCSGVPTLATLGQAGSFSEFSLGSAWRGKTSGSDAEGAVAYGGNATFDNFYVGAESTLPISLVVGNSVSGTVALLSGTKGVYQGYSSATTPGTSSPVSNLFRSFSPVNFAAAGGLLGADSSTFGAEHTTSGATIVSAPGTLTLTGTNAVENVFSLQPGQFAPAGTVFVHVPVGSTTVIDVPDGSLPQTMYQDFQYWDGSAYEAGAQYGSPAEEAVQDATLLNFPNASQVTFGSAALAATVLAPRANFVFNSGVLDGSVMAGTISGDFQSNLGRPFGGACSSQSSSSQNPWGWGWGH
jgi:choice-of-anchor A domain-containing protein